MAHHHNHHQPRNHHHHTPTKRRPKPSSSHFSLNDHVDILIEILTKLDARSLGIASCVCRLWWSITRNDSIWEHLCFRHLVPAPPPLSVRHVVHALGGYKRLYAVCLRPVQSRLVGSNGRRKRHHCSTDEGVELLRLTLSLFCVDYFERFGKNKRLPESSSSLMFLCEPVMNVST